MSGTVRKWLSLEVVLKSGAAWTGCTDAIQKPLDAMVLQFQTVQYQNQCQQCNSKTVQPRYSAIAMGATVLILQVEQKIAAELESHGLLATAEQGKPHVPDYADLTKLTYLSCVIKESMRMHTVSTSH